MQLDHIISNDEYLMNEYLTDIHIISHSKSLCVMNNEPSTKYEISAQFDFLPFSIDFVVIESDKEHPYIDSMNIDVKSAWKHELSPLVTMSIQNKSPILWMNGLRSFLKEVKYRQDIWRWMKETWDEYVYIPFDEYSSYVVIDFDSEHNNQNKLKFTLLWSIEWSFDGNIQPILRPGFNIQTEDTSINVKDYINQLYIHFQSLMQIKGIKSAITVLMKTGL
ncbi:hypothetical protein WA158_005565 [Blastocystis sp. Blastoise]